METMKNIIDIKFLENFSAAWNAHDIDALMSFMTDDCIFETAAGSHVYGNRFTGHEQVRKAFESAWIQFPDAQWLDASHFVFGDNGISEWRFCGTDLKGVKVEANGVDVFTFKDGKIFKKNVFRKQVVS
jgi:ketosteroid isomerase-like protein